MSDFSNSTLFNHLKVVAISLPSFCKDCGSESARIAAAISARVEDCIEPGIGRDIEMPCSERVTLA